MSGRPIKESQSPPDFPFYALRGHLVGKCARAYAKLDDAAPHDQVKSQLPAPLDERVAFRSGIEPNLARLTFGDLIDQRQPHGWVDIHAYSVNRDGNRSDIGIGF